MQVYLQASRFIDCDSVDVQAFAQRETVGAHTDRDKAIRLYYAVRDQIRYDPYQFHLTEGNFTASHTLQAGSSYCIPKAVLLAAAARSVGIPSQLGFADVRNHLSTPRLLDLMETDVFIWHGYTLLYINDQWVKATPAFNIDMCQRFAVKPLEFDGVNDSFMHAYDQKNEKHMEYLTDHGSFADLPYQQIIQAIQQGYPKFCAILKQQAFEKEYNFDSEKIPD